MMKPLSGAVIPAKAEALFNSECWSIHLRFCIRATWMIRFAYPFGAILRMFSALRATSCFRGNDGHEAGNVFHGNLRRNSHHMRARKFSNALSNVLTLYGLCKNRS